MHIDQSWLMMVVLNFNPSSNKLTLQGTSGVQVYGTSGHIDGKYKSN